MGYSIMGFRWIHGSFKTAAKRRHIIRLQYLTSSEVKTIQGQAHPRSQEVGTCKLGHVEYIHVLDCVT